MILRSIVLAGFGAWAAAFPLNARCQTAVAGAPPPEQRPADVIREIDDSATGDRWLLVRDAANPAGPGRMVRIETGKADFAGGAEKGPAQRGTQSSAAAPLRPVIHAGDVVIVEEHSAVVDARLEAVALGSAAVGAEFKARLKIGGKVVRAVALAAGRAEIRPGREAQR